MSAASNFAQLFFPDWYSKQLQGSRQKQLEGLLGTSPEYYQGQPEGPVQPGAQQQFATQPQIEGTGTGLLGSLPQSQQAQGKFFGGLMGVPGFEAAGAKGLMGMGGESGSFAGKGVDPQVYNMLIKYGQNPPKTQKEKLEYNVAYQRASRPQRFMDPSGQMIEYPGMNMQGLPVPEGLQDTGRKSLGKKPMAAESASKLAMMDTARYGTSVIEPILFKNGKVDRDIVKEAWGINVFEPAAALASPEAQQVYQAFEMGKQAITRTETGAAMPATEVRNTAKRFMPKPWDDDSVVKQKWAAYNLFLNNTTKYLDPNNLTADAIFNKAMADVKKPSGKASKIIDYKDL